MISFIVGVVVGAVVVDYLWARRTGVDKVVFARIREWWQNR